MKEARESVYAVCFIALNLALLGLLRDVLCNEMNEACNHSLSLYLNHQKS